jgi:hypothetical protein
VVQESTYDELDTDDQVADMAKDYATRLSRQSGGEGVVDTVLADVLSEARPFMASF